MEMPSHSHDEDVARLTAWLDDELGCTEVELHRQRRWRPVWHATVTQNGVRRKLLIKGERTWPTHPYSLDYEMWMQRTLQENGAPAPAILGMCPDPKAIVMEWKEGGRDPGMIQEAIERRSEMSPDRWQASLRYMEILADMHAIPPERFVAAGAHMPTTSDEIILGNFERFHAMTAEFGITHPILEFCARWLRRNAPRNRTRISFLTGDCGQFLSDGPEVTGVIDFEIGHLGDSMRDLACYRGRHPIENMGDIPALYRHYEQASGLPLDYDAIAYHTVTFLAEAIYGPLIGMHDTGRGGDWVESGVQFWLISRRCMEALAEIIGLELDDFGLPEPEPAPVEDLAFDKLIADIGRLPESDAFQGWQRNILQALPTYLRTRMRYRNWADREDRADFAALTGSGETDPVKADALLMRFVEQAGPDQDAALVRLFHRRMLRQCLILAGPNPGADHIALAKTEPILQHKR